MRSKLAAALILSTCLASMAGAQTAPDNPEQKRKLIEQKIRLVEMLVNSPAAKNAAYGREAESAALVEKGKQAVESARAALGESRFDDAAKLLDEALKSASSASRKLSSEGGGLSDSAQRKALTDLTEQVATYRTSVVDLVRDAKVGAAAKKLLGQIDALSAESKQLADAGRIGDANKKLAAAYKLAVEEISKLRAGHEVVMSLKFDTPADEYAYEQKRFSSNVLMVDMMIGEGRAEGDKRKMVDGFVGEGQKLKTQADDQARAGQYKEAVSLMEKATGQLNRALQSMGIPVF